MGFSLGWVAPGNRKKSTEERIDPPWGEESTGKGILDGGERMAVMIIKGIGIDLIEVERIRRAVARRQAGFRRRVFTPAEWEYCLRGGKINHASLAVRFAAKEAVFKALGCGWRQIPWREVEIDRGPGGEPLVRLGPRALALARERGIDSVLVSLTHTRGHAVAQALAQGKE